MTDFIDVMTDRWHGVLPALDWATVAAEAGMEPEALLLTWRKVAMIDWLVQDLRIASSAAAMVSGDEPIKCPYCHAVIGSMGYCANVNCYALEPFDLQDSWLAPKG